MKKLIQGIIEFHEARRGNFAEDFAKLALGQKPDALFIVCSDSRVAVNVFASTDPGDLFVLRNVGNLVPPHGHPGGMAAAAAVDFALETLHVRDIVVCGHSDCGAVRACLKGLENLSEGPLRDWLESGMIGEAAGMDPGEASRRNVLVQLDHLKSYPTVRRAIAERGLRLHGLWFDIQRVEVLYYEEACQRWAVLNAANGERILSQMDFTDSPDTESPAFRRPDRKS